jgi:hypothetical protein
MKPRSSSAHPVGAVANMEREEGDRLRQIEQLPVMRASPSANIQVSKAYCGGDGSWTSKSSFSTMPP